MSVEFDDNWIRTFRGKEIPKFNDEELKMLHEWRDNCQFGEISLYLTMDQFMGLNEEIAEFLLREIIRGNI